MIGKCWTVDRWSQAPQEITIVKETAKTYTESIVSSWDGKPHEYKRMKDSNNVFATWIEAKAWMVQNAMDNLDYAKQEVDRLRSKLETIKALKEPKE